MNGSDYDFTPLLWAGLAVGVVAGVMGGVGITLLIFKLVA